MNTDSLVEGRVLPVDGTYQIIVSRAGYRTGGDYTLIVESQGREDVTPAPGGGEYTPPTTFPMFEKSGKGHETPAPS